MKKATLRTNIVPVKQNSEIRNLSKECISWLRQRGMDERSIAYANTAPPSVQKLLEDTAKVVIPPAPTMASKIKHDYSGKGAPKQTGPGAFEKPKTIAEALKEEKGNGKDT